MPADIKVYRITMGGVREEMDEWSQTARVLISESLKQHLKTRYGFEIKFITEDWLKANHRDLWEDNRALFDAVSMNIFMHAYPGDNGFPSKMENFDYTLGTEISALAKVSEADALLFVQGFDYEATTGRNVMAVFNVLVGAAIGVIPIYHDPIMLSLGLVDGESGNVEWFKATPADNSNSFLNKKQVEALVEWLTRDFVKTPAK